MKYLKTTLGALSVVFVAIACDKTPTAPTNSIAPNTPSLISSAADPAPVDLGLSGNFAILSKAGITDVSPSDITGNIGTYPINGVSIGVPCTEVTGTIYERDATYVVGTCTNVTTNATLLTTAVSDMETAYTNAAGRPAGVGPNLNLGGGTVSTNTLSPGTYTWGTPVTITGDITLNGGANDVWLFQIAGTLDMAASQNIVLTGGAQAKNVFWQVSGVVTLLADSHFEGTILAATKIAMVTGAELNGRALAQTEVTLQQNIITTTETKKECEGLLKAEKKVFADDQKADKKTFENGQKADKIAFLLTNPTSADKKTFDNQQKSDKQAFDDGQKTDKQAFELQQKNDQERCNTL